MQQDNPIADNASRSLDGFLEWLAVNTQFTSESKSRALTALRSSKQPSDVVMTELGLMPDIELASKMAIYFDQVPFDKTIIMPDIDLCEQIGRAFLKTNGLLPVVSDNGELVLAVADPFDTNSVDAVSFKLEKQITVVPYPRASIVQILDELVADESLNNASTTIEILDDASGDDMERLQDIASEAPVVRFLSSLVQNAVDRRATDIHLEPLRNELVTRCRVDGILQQMSEIPRELQSGVVTRLKVLARLNVAERRRPQDGRLRVTVRGKNIDLRVSTLPSINGESIVLRILDKSNTPLDLEGLGFGVDARVTLRNMAQSHNGMILATGPTGSGKTTTLYALLQSIIRPEIKVFTIEDPVEYKLDEAVQLQVNGEIDFTFANSLRSVLRQDPDVILVGEIRDRETAEIAIRASLTGHLVFSTLHTNSAVEAITRLRDMGVEPFLIAATVRGIIGQRLLRKTCDSCNEKRLALENCQSCGGLGLAFMGEQHVMKFFPSPKKSIL